MFSYLKRMVEEKNLETNTNTNKQTNGKNNVWLLGWLVDVKVYHHGETLSTTTTTENW